MARIDDGYQTLIVFGSSSTTFWEKTVTPPGVDGGGEIDTTTMHNDEWRTKSPKQLKTLTEVSAEVAYDPAVYDDILASINVNQAITIHFPDGQVLTFYGWLNSFVPNANKEGEQPTAEIKVIPSNQNANVETAPSLS